MKRSMILTAGALSLVAGMAGAQPSEPIPKNSAQALQERRDRFQAEYGEKLMSVSFSGGTIGQYVDALRKAAPDGSANVVVSERASKVPISEIKLRDVSLGVAINSIPAAYSGPRGAWHLGPVGSQSYGPGQPGVGIPMGQVAAFNTTYSVDFETQADVDMVDMEVSSFSLGRLLNPTGAAAAEGDPSHTLTAIETGLLMLSEKSERQATLKFHPESSLLFVRGSKAQVGLVGSVISRMTEETMRRQEITQRRMRAEKLRELAVKRANLQVKMSELEHQGTRAELDRLHKEFDAGTLGAQELAEAKSRLVRKQMEVEMAKLRLEQAMVEDSDRGNDQSADAPADAAVPLEQAPNPTTPRPAGIKRPNR